MPKESIQILYLVYGGEAEAIETLFDLGTEVNSEATYEGRKDVAAPLLSRGAKINH